MLIPQWGAADAEIKVPSGENTELKRSPFQAWSRSVYSLTCYAYCQGFLPCLFLPLRSIPFTCIFFQNLSRFFLCWLWLTHGSCVGPQNKIGHPAGCRFPFLSACRIKEVIILDAGSHVECPRKINRPQNMTCDMMTYEINNLEIVNFVISPDVILCG